MQYPVRNNHKRRDFYSQLVTIMKQLDGLPGQNIKKLHLSKFEMKYKGYIYVFERYLTCSDPSNNAIRYALSSGAVMAALYP